MGDAPNHSDYDDGEIPSGSVVTRTKVRATRPNLYKVILHNDDYTPMDFVVDILEVYFKKKHAEANDIMLAVHTKGQGICGIFPYEVAETKVAQVTEAAKEASHPLKCSMERA